jgi:SH3-like domain-containing protein
MVGRGLFAALLIVATAPALAQEKQPPYWASLASGQAMMRTGPARTYPGTWLYQRRDLPVLVLKRYETWRLIRDPDGTQGWMLSTMLSDRRTAIVRAGDPRPIYSKPGGGGVRYRAEQGVVGKIDHCADGWCRIIIGKRQGYIQTSEIWGVGEHELLD